MDTFVKNIFKFILDVLFPIRCIGCAKEGSWICQRCALQIPALEEHVCGICEKMVTPDGRTCIDCKRKSALDALVPAVPYNHSFVAKSVHFFKYRFVKDLHRDLGSLVAKSIRKTDLPIPDLIIPIPLHPRRLRWRGFNQSGLLAAHVAKNLLPLTEISLEENLLIRKRHTKSQMKIKDYSNRKQNIIGAFQVTRPQTVQNKTILLIDDICTTGSTIFECAKVLKTAGAKEVYAAVIARQEIKD